MDSSKLSKLSWNELLALRAKAGDSNKEAQNILAPFEHRAYARETMAADPSLQNLLGLLVATPAYTGAKAAGLAGGRSDPSLETLLQGLIGIGEGTIQGAQGGLEELIQLMKKKGTPK